MERSKTKEVIKELNGIGIMNIEDKFVRKKYSKLLQKAILEDIEEINKNKK